MKFKGIMAAVPFLVMGAASAQDMDAIKASVMEDLKSKVAVSSVIDAVKAQNVAHAGLDEAGIIELDKKWRAEVSAGGGDMVSGVLANDVSALLKGLKDGSAGTYSEIFVVDNKGLNVGQSGTTSDYWQGDEAKFKQTYGLGADAVFMDEVEFDESSQTFATQVSATLNDPATGEPIGAVTFGVNVEQ